MAEQNPSEDDLAVDLRILSRGITSEEAAAVTAVLVAAVAEEAEHAAVEKPAPNEWANPRHALRRPVEVGPGRWTHSIR
jgi:hypothetical protein